MAMKTKIFTFEVKRCDELQRIYAGKIHCQMPSKTDAESTVMTLKIEACYSHDLV